MKKRWIKWNGKAPKFTDPAEAEFEIKNLEGQSAHGAIYVTGRGFCVATRTGSIFALDQREITHYRRM